MYPILFGAALIVGVACWLDSESSSAKRKWESRQQDLADEMDYQRSKLRAYREHKARNVQFYHLVNEHYKSVQMGNAAYALLEECQQVITTYYQAIQRLKDRRKAIGIELKSALKGTDKQALYSERKLISGEVDKFYAELEPYQTQKDQFLQKVRDLNEGTRHLKLMIRDTTGEKGRDWYDRGEARRLARAH